MRRQIGRSAFVLVLAAISAGVGYGVSRLVASPTGQSVSNSLTPLDIAFASPLRAYEIVKEGSATYVATSDDGGRSWTIAEPLVSSPPPALAPNGPHFPSTGAAPSVGVTNTGTVFAFGVSRSVVVVSTDQGRTWRTSNLPGTVEDIASSSSVLTALVDGPQPKGTPTHVVPPPAAGWLYSSRDSGVTWSRLSVLPADVGPYKLLVQTSPSDLYALAPGENNTNAGVYGGLVASSDGGRIWRAAESPCDVDASPRFGADAQFGATSSGTLWLVCGDSLERTSSGNLTQVTTSPDGGKSWTLVAGTQEIAPYGHWNFPATAGVPVASPQATSVFAQMDSWLVLSGPSLLVMSADGGGTWSDGAPSALERQGPLFVVAVDHQLLVRTQAALWRFASGRWSVVR